MPKLTKRIVDALQAKPRCDVFAWDAELRGFGVRVKPSGTKTFIIQYRNAEGRTRRFVVGQFGVLRTEGARALAQRKLASVIDGRDPSAERRAARAEWTISDVCDWYLEEAGAGRLLGRNRRPIKPSTLAGDRSRIESHIKPLIGKRVISSPTSKDFKPTSRPASPLARDEPDVAGKSREEKVPPAEALPR